MSKWSRITFYNYYHIDSYIKFFYNGIVFFVPGRHFNDSESLIVVRQFSFPKGKSETRVMFKSKLERIMSAARLKTK